MNCPSSVVFQAGESSNKLQQSINGIKDLDLEERTFGNENVPSKNNNLNQAEMFALRNKRTIAAICK